MRRAGVGPAGGNRTGVPEPRRLIAHRRAAGAAAPTPFRRAVLERAAGRCALCDAPAVEAVAGGRRASGAGVAVCRACHVRMN